MPEPLAPPPPSAVALLSGGLDSAVAAACVLAEGSRLHTLTIDYGQRCRAELAASRAVSDHLGAASHRVVTIDLRAIGGSALTDTIGVPLDRDHSEIGTGVPVTYVPARNTVLLAVALGLAEVVGADELIIGANSLDYSGYPDCRGPFLMAFEELANLATAAGVEGRRTFRVRAPLLELGKGAIVGRGNELRVPFLLTMSCYDPVPVVPGSADGAWLHCGRCDSCSLRRKGFADAGLPDPTPYHGDSGSADPGG